MYFNLRTFSWQNEKIRGKEEREEEEKEEEGEVRSVINNPWEQLNYLPAHWSLSAKTAFTQPFKYNMCKVGGRGGEGICVCVCVRKNKSLKFKNSLPWWGLNLRLVVLVLLSASEIPWGWIETKRPVILFPLKAKRGRRKKEKKGGKSFCTLK